MPTGNAADSALGAVGFSLETTPLTYLAPTNWLYPETNTFAAKPDMLKKPVMSGTRAANRIVRPLKLKTEGGLGHPLFATHGAKLNKLFLGADTFLTALTTDAVKAATPITTTAGISTITLANAGAVTYTQYAWVVVNTGTASESRQILTITTNGAPNTVITVGALIGNATAAAGTVVKQIGQHKFTTNVTGTTLPTASMEINEAGQYAWKLAGVYGEKINYKASGDEVQVMGTYFGTVKPVQLASPTTPTPATEELSDLTHPMSIVDTQLTTFQDPGQAGGSTGPSAQQMNTWIEDWEIDWDNKLIKKKFHDLTYSYRAFPGIQDATVKYSYVNISGRQSEFDDYLANQSTTPFPVTLGAAQNLSATSTEKWRCWGAVCPSLQLVQAPQSRKIGDLLVAAVEGYPIPVSATGDLVQVFVVNADVTAY